MKSELKEIAYELEYEVNHFEDLGLDWRKDIEIVKYDNYPDYRYFDTEPVNHPDPVIYTGYLDIVRHIDYPYPDNSWNVMSRKMYEALLSVGDFPHQSMPVAIVDWRVQPEDWYDTTGNLKKDIALRDYVAIQITEHLDIFDYDKSTYTMREDRPGMIDDVKEFVFKIPADGLPPIFKVSAKDFYVFVSAEARQALKKAKVSGTRYISLKGENKEHQSETDVEIKVPAEVYA